MPIILPFCFFFLSSNIFYTLFHFSDSYIFKLLHISISSKSHCSLLPLEIYPLMNSSEKHFGTEQPGSFEAVRTLYLDTGSFVYLGLVA